LANRHTQRWLGRELELMRREDVIAEFAGACQTGNFDIAPVIAGETVALVRDIRSANEIVWRTVAEAERLLAGGSHWVTKENSAAA
jgi:nitronate monooxygenase